MSDDLWDMIEKGEFRKGGAANPALSNRQKLLRSKAKRNEELARTLQKKVQEQKAEVRSMLNWLPEARVIVIFEATCACGSVHQYPEIFLQAPTPLLRYRNKLNNAIWEKRAEPGELIPRGLKTEARIISMHTDHCISCKQTLLGDQK